MTCLPRLTAGPSAWRLPLLEHTAAGLARLFVEDASDDREQLTDLLTDDPAFALWTVCRATSADTQSPTGIKELADWLYEHGLTALQWCTDELTLHPAPERKKVVGWADWAAKAVATARCVKRLAGKTDAERAYLFGLLHGSVEWLSSSGSQVSLTDVKSEATCLPRWLAHMVVEIEDRPPKSFLPKIVARAMDHVRDASTDTTHDSGSAVAVDVEADRRYGTEIRDRWTATPVGAAYALPPLMRKLARLRELETRFQSALETEKLESLKALAYGASHEINNPLANISTRAQTLMREEKNPERHRKLAEINKQAFRAHEMIADMMLFARPPALQREPVNLTGLVDELIRELAPDAERQGTELFRVTADEPLVVEADGGHLAVALRALCTNSLEALSVGGRIEMFVQLTDEPPADSNGTRWAEILVSDTGPGIPPEVRRHLFDPYYSGREAGRGLGLGLSKCWRIVTEHGGHIDVSSEPTRGSTFAIRLPMEACPNTPTAH